MCSGFECGTVVGGSVSFRGRARSDGRWGIWCINYTILVDLDGFHDIAFAFAEDLLYPWQVRWHFGGSGGRNL